MIVVDVGAASYGTDESILFLLNEFKPRLYYGFDPSRQYQEGRIMVGNTHVVTRRAAAWVEDGTLAATPVGFGLTMGSGQQFVECFDLAAFLEDLWDEGDSIVLKLDVEKCEYELLPHLIEHDIDEWLELIWVEWHCLSCAYGRFQVNDVCSHCGHSDIGLRSSIESALRCEVRQWDR